MITTARTNQIAVIDSSVADYQVLADAAREAGLEVILLSGHDDGLAELAAKLEGRSGIEALHIFSHGRTGEINFGDTVLSGESISDYVNEIEVIKESLATNGDVLVYGCEIGADAAGKEFLEKLALATGSDVAFSDDLTGAKELGGDWDLEVQHGAITTPSLRVSNYQQVLYTDLDFSSVGNYISGSPNEPYAGSDNVPDVKIYFEVSPNQTISGLNAQVFSAGVGTGISHSTEVVGWFHVMTYKNSTDFDMGGFQVYNESGSDVTLTITGYDEGNAYYPDSNTTVESTTANAVNGQWTTVSLSGFTGISSVKIDTGSTVSDLYINHLLLQKYTAPAPAPAITSTTYDASTNLLSVTAANITGGDPIDVSKLTLTGEGGQTYTLTSDNVTASSDTAFSVTLNATDQLHIEGLLNQDGTTSASSSATFNLAAADDWDTDVTDGDTSVTTSAVTVSNTQTPAITSATYNTSTGALTVTGTDFVRQNGAANDIDLSTLTFTGGSSAAFTLTTASDAEITDATTFSATLSGSDKTGVDALLNANGTQSSDSTIYNLAVADDWNGPITGGDISDTTGNGITVSDSLDSLVVTTNAVGGVDATQGANYAADVADGGGLSFQEATLYAAGGGKTISFASSLDGQKIDLYLDSGEDATLVAGTTLDADAVNDLTLGFNEGILTVEGALTVTNGSGDTLTIQGISGGSGALTKTGAGTLVWGERAPWYDTTYDTTLVSEGVLSVAADSALGTGAVTLGGGTLRVTGVTTIDNAIAMTADSTIDTDATVSLSGIVSGSGNMTKSGTGNLILSGANTNTGAIAVSAGTLTGTTSSLVSNIANNAAVVFNQSADGTYSQAISGTGILTKSGAGTVTLSGSNTYTGTTAVSAGTLVASGGSAIADTGAVAVASSANFQLASSETIGTLNGAGAVTLGANTLTLNQSTSTSFSGAIGGAGGLIKSGTGELTLDGTNTYTGATTLSAGQLILNSGSGTVLADSSAVTVAAGATLFALYDETLGSIAGAGNIDLNSSVLTVGGDGSSTTFSGVISGGDLAKTGAGTLTLSGANTYDGTTTVSDGTLSISGDANLGGGAVALEDDGTLAVTGVGAQSIDNAITVDYNGGILSYTNSASGDALTLTGAITGDPLALTGAGLVLIENTTNTAAVDVSAGTLGGNGQVGNLTLSGGTLAPGAGAGDLDTGNLTLNSSASFSVELGGTTVATQYDQVKVTGTVNLGGATLNASLINSFTPAINDSFVIIDNDGSDAVTGTFSGLAEGASVTVGAYALTISYQGGTGNDVVLTRANTAPIITSNGGGATAAVNVAENSTAVTTVNATDADSGDTLIYSLTGGADQALFSIDPNSGALSFIDAPDYENPQDQGDTAGNNTYVVEVEASDGSATDTQTLTVSVTDTSEAAAPTISAVAFGTTSGTLKVGDTLKLTITADASGYTADTITVNGQAVTDFTDNSDNSYTVTYTVAEGDQDIADNAPIPISVVLSHDDVSNTAYTTAPPADQAPRIDAHTPTTTIASGTYTASSHTLILTGTDFTTLREPGETAATNIKGRLDWSKLVWDINGDDGTSANLGFSVADIASAKVIDGAHLSIVLTSTKATALSATDGYGAAGNADTLDITAGFTRDLAGNVSTTDAKANAPLTLAADTTPPTTTIASGAYAQEARTLTLTGTNFATLLETDESAATDIKGRLDWSKLVWDINGDDGASANVSFALSAIASAKVIDGEHLSIVLTSTKAAALTGAGGYGNSPTADTLDVAAGFTRDLAGNASTSDAKANAPLAIAANAPVVDLNGTGTGLNTGATLGASALAFTTGGANLAPGLGGGTTFTHVKVAFASADMLDGANETIEIAGATAATAIALNASSTNTFTLSGTEYAYAVTDAAGTRTLTFTPSGGGTLSQADAEALLDALRYHNTTTPPTSGDRTFRVTAKDATQDSAVATFMVSGDDDGVSTAEENAAPTLSGVAGDGNGDGVADSVQGNVTSSAVTDGDGRASYVTIATAVSQQNVTITPAPDASELPSNLAGSQFLQDVVSFDLPDVPSGGTQRITLYVDASLAVNDYLKQDQNGHWVSVKDTLANDGDPNTTFSIATTDDGTKKIIAFDVTDGGALDSDGLVNGRISDPGAPAFVTTNSLPVITSNGGGATAAVDVAENTTAVTAVTSTDADADDPRTYAITGGADAAKFGIQATSGVLTFLRAPDYEAPTDSDANNTYVVNVTATDTHGGADTQALTVNVTNVAEGGGTPNRAPVITSNGGADTATLAIAENTTAVTAVTASDADRDALTYSLSGGADQAFFTIDASSGALRFKVAPDYENPTDTPDLAGGAPDNRYQVNVTVSDGHGGSDRQQLSVQVNDVAEGCPYVPFQPDQDGDGMPDTVEAQLGFDPAVKDNDVFGNDALFVRQIYRDLLWREGEDGGVAYWTEALGSASLSRAQVAERFIDSQEFQGGVGALTRLYEGALERTPDACGLDYWMAQRADGLDLETSAQVILESAEFAQRHGDPSDDALIDTLTQAMLAREATSAERGQWEQALANGTSAGSLLLTLTNSEEYRARSDETVSLDLFYLGLLNRDPDIGGYAYWQEAIADADTPFTFIGGFFASAEYHDRFLPASAQQNAGQDMPELALLGQHDSADPGLTGSLV